MVFAVVFLKQDCQAGNLQNLLFGRETCNTDGAVPEELNKVLHIVGVFNFEISELHAKFAVALLDGACVAKDLTGTPQQTYAGTLSAAGS